MTFHGFGKQALPFFKALAFHQNKEWYDENKGLYESEVKQPFGALIADVAARFEAEGIPLKGSPKGSMFRLHRDVRFSKDKNPYKTHAGGTLSRTGARMEPGLLYIHIDPKGCFLGAAFRMPEPAELLRLRSAIRRDEKGFGAMLANLEKSGLSLLDSERLTRAPRGFDTVSDPVCADAVRLKSFIVRRSVVDETIASTALVDETVIFAKDVFPFLAWGWAAIVDNRP